MANEHIVETLARRYPELQHVRDTVFRGVDKYDGRPYAIRYFDIGGDLSPLQRTFVSTKTHCLAPRTSTPTRRIYVGTTISTSLRALRRAAMPFRKQKRRSNRIVSTRES